MAEDAFGIVGSVIASAYHVESVVAEGGFGTVYRAHHGGFRAPVALKCLRLPPGLVPEARQHFLEAFRAEAELLFLLSASIPAVVRPLHVDAFTLPDGRLVPYLVLEWLEGRTLDALIRQRRSDGQPPLALKKLVRLLTPVARALERAHNFIGPQGPVSIVHRDLKPENIFVANVAGEEVVKILDFGIGKAKSVVSQVAGRASQGSAGIATFTPAYGSPEQWAPKRYGQTGPWTDVWGLALSLTEALVGRPVIDGDPAAIMGTVLDPARRPTPGSEGVPLAFEVERVFAKALALDPRERYADAGVFWNELLTYARITSGEMPEVRMPRDARAEPGGGVRVERLEMPRRPSGRPPTPAPVAALPSQAARPTLDAPSAAAAAMLRPVEPSAVPVAPALSGSFQVPDLDLAPISRPSGPRAASGMHRAMAVPIALDDQAEDHALDIVPAAALDLDLPATDPIVRRASSGAMTAVRPSEPPASLNVAQRESGAGEPPAPVVYATPNQSRALASSTLAAEADVPAVATAAPTPPKPSFEIKLKPAPEATLLARLLPGLLLLASAVVLTVLDQVYTAIAGSVFEVLGLRTSMLAGLMMVLGIVLCLYRLKRD